MFCEYSIFATYLIAACARICWARGQFYALKRLFLRFLAAFDADLTGLRR